MLAARMRLNLERVRPHRREGRGWLSCFSTGLGRPINRMENRMNTVSSRAASDEDSGLLVDEMERLLDAQGQEGTYWSGIHATRPYVSEGEPFEDYAPAYVYGVVWYQSYPERQFDEWDGDLATGWDAARGDSPLDWPKAKPAVREAWYRISDLAARAKSERAEVLAEAPQGPTPGDH
jgi:hypothetical protein